MSEMQVALTTNVSSSFDDVVAGVRKALADQGFGVLTEIDMRAALNAKLGDGAGDEVGDYLILGACNPGFARQAVGVFPQVGVLLPCNVVVRRAPGAEAVTVDAMNPGLMAQVTSEPALAEIAGEVRTRLQAALDAL